MPMVRSYYRRAPGAASAEQPRGGPALDVAIYSADGATLLRERCGSRSNVRGLSFSSSLPGGFASAAFRLTGAAARFWPGRAGLRCAVRWGERVLWWGWVEDIRPSGRGTIDGLEVTCLGPYQELQQRLGSPNFSGTVYGEQALAQQLAVCCPDIATDYSHLASTGIDLGPLVWTEKEVAELVQTVCKAGNSAGQPLLFALWEPNGRLEPVSNVLNPGFEDGPGIPPAHWSLINGGSWSWAPEYHGAWRSLKMTGTAATGYCQQTNIPCAASTTYTVDYWAKQTSPSGGTHKTYWRIIWYDAGGGQIATNTGTEHASNATTGWVNWVETVSSPANAHHYGLQIYLVLAGTGSNALWLDDVYVYASKTSSAKPVPYLWPRDVTAADYRLQTALLDADLSLELTTQDLANAVKATYGESGTAWAEDAASEALYRRRDYVLSAGDVSSTVATAMRDTYLTRHKAPLREPGSFRLQGLGALQTLHGRPVDPVLLRAGDRLQVADGPLAGTIILLTQVAYADGAVNCTPERRADVPLLLAKII